MSMVQRLLAIATVVLATAAQSGPVIGQGTWEATLKPRDLDGNGVTDAFYDTALNVTWLRDVTGNGLMSWTDATNWVDGLDIAGYSDWRLPSIVDKGFGGCNNLNQGGTDCGYNVLTPTTSELAHLWYVTLGNKAICIPGDAACWPNFQEGWGLKNTGDFPNINTAFQDNPSYGLYWYGTAVGWPGPGPNPLFAWFFDVSQGRQSIILQNSWGYAMAVRSGDVAATEIPEPASLLLALTALGTLGLVRRRTRHRRTVNCS